MATCQGPPGSEYRIRCSATQRATGLLLSTFVAMLVGTSGCAAGGGSFTIFPNHHSLTESAESIAAAAARHQVSGRELDKSALPAWYVQPGDELLIEVNDLDADFRLPPDQTVMLDGSVDLGRFGRVVVSGMTIEEVEGIVLGVIQASQTDIDDDSVNVRLISADGAMFYVLGEVNAPGSYPLIGRETALDAILTAGGLSDRAAECRIILSRPTHPCSCRVVLPVCYQDIVQLGDTTTNYQIRPGDRIYVASRSMCDEISFLQQNCEQCPDRKQCGCQSPHWSLRRIFSTNGPVTIPAASVPRSTSAENLTPSAPNPSETPFSEALQLLSRPAPQQGSD